MAADQIILVEIALHDIGILSHSVADHKECSPGTIASQIVDNGGGCLLSYLHKKSFLAVSLNVRKLLYILEVFLKNLIAKISYYH